MEKTGKKRVVILGGGFGGAFAAQRLIKKGGGDIEVVLIDRNNYLTFYPLLVEAGVGSVEPRHVVVPLRRFTQKGRFIMGEVKAVDPATKTVTYDVAGSLGPETITYDHLVVGLGSVTRMPPVPGLLDFGFQVKTIGDVIEHRDRGIRLLELAATLRDPAEKKRLLTFVVVGGNYTGVEMAGEYHAFLCDAMKRYSELSPEDLRMVLVERSEHLLGMVKPSLAVWCEKTLRDRGIEVRTKTSVDGLSDFDAVLSTGEIIPTETIIWAAGVAPNPVYAHLGLPLNKVGYLDCQRDLHVTGFDDVWAIGDGATIPNRDGKPYAPTAQNASRMGPAVADNILATLRGEKAADFHFETLGSFAAIGRRQAVAEVKGTPIKGFLGWVMYRGAYLSKIPGLGTKVRLMADWLLELVLPIEPVQLGVYSGKPGRELRVAPVTPKPDPTVEAITR